MAADENRKLAFFVKPGFEDCLGGLKEALASDYEVRQFVVERESQVDEGMEWANIVWFECCDELAVYGSRCRAALEKPVIIRLMGSEAFTEIPSSVSWENIDRALFTAEHLRNYSVGKFGIPLHKTFILPTGLQLKKFKFKARGPGHKVAFYGELGSHDGSFLMLHAFKAMYQKNRELSFHLAVLFQDEQDVLYFQHLTEGLGLSGHVFLEKRNKGGKPDEEQAWLDRWLEDKSFYLCAGRLQLQDEGVIMAMAKGIKPIIHHSLGADNYFPEDLLFYTPEEGGALLNGPYDSRRYRHFALDRYDVGSLLPSIKELLTRLSEISKEKPLVSVVMAVANGEKLIAESISCVLSQTYDRLELIIVDDGSTDKTSTIVKGFSDTRIRYIKRRRAGLNEALKAGYKAAVGKFVTRVDWTDRVDKDYIDLCVDAMNKDFSLKFVYTDFYETDEKGELLSITGLRSLGDPLELIFLMIASFSSIIPDKAFWRADYTETILLNALEESIPFYADNLLSAPFEHIPIPLYGMVTLSDEEEALHDEEEDQFRETLGMIKCVDLLFRKYILQMNITGDFNIKEMHYYRLMSEYFLNHAQNVPAGQEWLNRLFLEEACLWLNKMSGAGIRDYANHRILLVCSDEEGQSFGKSSKDTHIRLLETGLRDNRIPVKKAFYTSDGGELFGMTEVRACFGLDDEDALLIDDSDMSFYVLVYSIMHKLEAKLEKLLEGGFISVIHCQDILSVRSVSAVLERLGMAIPIILTHHGSFVNEGLERGTLKPQGQAVLYFREFEKKALAQAGAIITLNKDQARQLKTLYPDRPAAVETVLEDMNPRSYVRSLLQHYDKLL